jgi:hypothetical protein
MVQKKRKLIYLPPYDRSIRFYGIRVDESDPFLFRTVI